MIRSKTRRAAARLTACLPTLAVVIAAAAARAEDAGECLGFGDLKDKPDLAMARIAGPASRAPFVKGASGAPGCPAAAETCREKAYLVPGDPVVAGRVRNGFTCVDYIGAKGADRAGWIATDSVAREPGSPVAAADWVGHWAQEEATIVVKAAAGGRLALHGDATWGASDPDRVKRGAVNIGAFDATAAPAGATLAFDVGDKATLPVDKGDESDCKLWMRRVGPYLLVDDNNMCGGMNVTFRGIYGHARP